MSKHIVPLLTVALSWATLSAGAQDLTADEIVAKANQASYYVAEDGRAQVKMTITQGRNGSVGEI